MGEIVITKIGMVSYLTPTGQLNNQQEILDLQNLVDNCLTERQVHLVIDLATINVVNSVALEGFILVQEKLGRHGGSLKVVNANPLVLEIFRITGFRNFVEVMAGQNGISG